MLNIIIYLGTNIPVRLLLLLSEGVFHCMVFQVFYHSRLGNKAPIFPSWCPQSAESQYFKLSATVRSYIIKNFNSLSLL